MSVAIDHVIVVCTGCRRERTVYFDKPLNGAQELVVWMKTKLTPCGCGATTCDVKAHIQGT